ncbi:MAG: hypothetical protein BMS9Abin26_0298 [Gammaproteobacteria bacterium]|nr:MAG: hypothetical protein BMS9Abin26_0298 [Gammaproteobacteria bacterium]
MRLVRYVIPALLIIVFSGPLLAAEGKKWIQPYHLASQSAGKLADVTSQTKSKLQGAGFSVVGEYSPYSNVNLVVVSNDTLKSNAAKSPHGGYGAAIRVAITQVGDKVQVSYVNPEWMSGMFQLKSLLTDVDASLKAALGFVKGFGTENLWDDLHLREYHYMVFMPYFADQLDLAEHKSYEDAVKAVEAGLAAGKAGVGKVYRIDIPGKKETVFGVSIKSGKGSDKAVMAVVDKTDIRHSAHLPYEMLVSGNKVYALHGKFRIAQSFPDLTMTTFMNISDAPDGIEDALSRAAGGK